jgi:hypothetical protein
MFMELRRGSVVRIHQQTKLRVAKLRGCYSLATIKGADIAGHHQTMLRFQLIGFKTQFGQIVGIVGSCDELGRWNAAKCLRGSFVEAQQHWELTLERLPMEPTFEYKYIIFWDQQPQHIIWESCENRSFSVATAPLVSGNTLTLKETWNSPSKTMV